MPIVPVVADFNHANPVDMAKLASDGFWGVILKGAQGVAFRDPAYPKRQAEARSLGLMVAAYDFATSDDVATNAADFLKYANLLAEDGAVLDFEDNPASQMSGDQAYEWLDRVAQARGRCPWLYGGNRIREQINPQDPKWIDMAAVCYLWECRYLKAVPADNAALFNDILPIPPWKKTTLIQYTGDNTGPPPHTVPGLESGADLNAFLGTRDELAALWPGMAVTFDS